MAKIAYRVSGIHVEYNSRWRVWLLETGRMQTCTCIYCTTLNPRYRSHFKIVIWRGATGHIFTNVFLTDWFVWYWTRLCFRVGALGEFIAFAFELFACRWMQSNCVFERGVTGWIHYSLFLICFRVNLTDAGYHLIDCFRASVFKCRDFFSLL